MNKGIRRYVYACVCVCLSSRERRAEGWSVFVAADEILMQ